MVRIHALGDQMWTLQLWHTFTSRRVREDADIQTEQYSLATPLELLANILYSKFDHTRLLHPIEAGPATGRRCPRPRLHLLSPFLCNPDLMTAHLGGRCSMWPRAWAKRESHRLRTARPTSRIVRQRELSNHGQPACLPACQLAR